MSISTADRYTESHVTQEAVEKSDRTAALFTLLGTDCRDNISTIVSQARQIFEADLSLYLAADSHIDPIVSGSLSRESLSRLRPWAKQTLTFPDEDGLVLLGSEMLPEGANLNCQVIACIPVTADQVSVGLLMAGFETARGFGPDDHQAALCLAGALSLQHRLLANEQKKSIGVLARQVAHELNNILSGLVSYPELILMQMDDTSALKGPISLMHDAGLQAAEMVQDFLILARPSDQQGFRSISPSVSARSYCQTTAFTALATTFPKARFSFYIDPDLPDIKGTDELIPKLFTTLLHHTVQNLTGPGQVIVTLKENPPPPGASRPGSGNGGIILTIEDNGAKTDEKDLDHLFEPFYTKKNMGRQGSGLGLAAIKKLIQDQGGCIEVESGPVQGTRFKIFLPALPC